MQLDIFSHSRDVMLRNDVVAALERRDADSARAARLVLQGEFAGDDSLAAQAVLIDALESACGVPLANHDAARDARKTLADAVVPAACRLLGDASAPAWMVPLWRDLAARSAALPFRAEARDEHAAPLWLRAGDWTAAVDAVGRIESWRRIPAPLAWMAEARYRIDGLDAAWPLLVELAWLAPKRFDGVARSLADASLERLRKRFDAAFEGRGDIADLAWFPAWLLIDTPALARLVGQAQPSLQEPAERAMRLLLDLLELERRGRHDDLIAGAASCAGWIRACTRRTWRRVEVRRLPFDASWPRVRSARIDHSVTTPGSPFIFLSKVRSASQFSARALTASRQSTRSARPRS